MNENEKKELYKKLENFTPEELDDSKIHSSKIK